VHAGGELVIGATDDELRRDSQAPPDVVGDEPVEALVAGSEVRGEAQGAQEASVGTRTGTGTRILTD